MKQHILFPILLFSMLGMTALPVSAQLRRLTHDEAVRAATAKPQPDYPVVAKQLRISGNVEVEVSIDPSGAVDGIKVLTGNPALTGGLASTLKRWHFEPILQDGKPTRAVAVLSFSFKL
jgi:TonB family protein